MTNKRLHASTTSINRLVLRGWIILFLSFCIMQLQAQPTLTTTTNITWSEKPQATAIAAGGKHSLALLSNGTVVAWGDNTYF